MHPCIRSRKSALVGASLGTHSYSFVRNVGCLPSAFLWFLPFFGIRTGEGRGGCSAG